jgi:ribosome maturation factor RimP
VGNRNVTARVRELLEDWLPEQGYELWNVEYVKSGRERNLNVYIDRLPAADTGAQGGDAAGLGAHGDAVRQGIGTDDCEAVSRYLSDRLDADDLIEGNYYLVVSSPGMDRPLLTDAHYARYEGVPVDVSLYKGVDGRKSYSGVLGARTDSELIIFAEDGREVRLPRELVSKVRLQVIF